MRSKLKITRKEEQIIDKAIKIIEITTCPWKNKRIKPQVLDRLQEFVIYTQRT